MIQQIKDNAYLVFGVGVLLFFLVALFIVGTTNTPGESSGAKLPNGITLSVDKPYQAPEIQGIENWFNSDPLTLESLKGKVVLVDFWTYSCINCIRTLPFLRDWHEKYAEDGLVIIGVHAPEFAFEKLPENVEQAIGNFEIEYPVAMDNEFTTWRAYENRYWPAKYFVDKEGNVVHTHFGEGAYEESEEIIRYLLEQSGADVSEDEVASDDDYRAPTSQGQSPETYIGYKRGAGLVQANVDQLAIDAIGTYDLQSNLSQNQWSLGGSWELGEEDADTRSNGAKLSYHFAGKEVYLVMGSEAPADVKVMLDGKQISAEQAGGDVKDGVVTVETYQLYRLVSLPEFSNEHTLTLEFPEGVQINAFTFGS